jgi:nucleoside-diphosphate-sugar epimerase
MTTLCGKRLVILGCGYLGSAVAREAIAAGMEVDALTRNPARAAELAGMGAKAVMADLALWDWHDRVRAGAELVLNCVSSGWRGIEGYRRSYVDGMRSSLAWAVRQPVGPIVFTGSTSVYPQDGGAMVDESASTEGTGENGALLMEAETLLREARRACDRWFILRLGGIYGPGRHHLLDQIRAGVATIKGSGSHRLNLTHRDDVCSAVWSAFSAPVGVRNRIFNVTDDGPATRAEIVQWLAGRTGQTAPSFPADAAGMGRRFSHQADRRISNARIKAELGWRPRYPTFREGYQQILAALAS